MSIKTTQDITRQEAEAKLQSLLYKMLSEVNILSDRELCDAIEELDDDIFTNYRIDKRGNP